MESQQINKPKGGVKVFLQGFVEAISAKLETSIINARPKDCRVVYGPYESFEHGTVLVLDNMPKKSCTYNCRYCNEAETVCCTTELGTCVSSYAMSFFVGKELEKLKKEDITINTLLLAPHGEATLDGNLFEQIGMLRQYNLPIAVYSNSSLLWNERMIENLRFADSVTLKIDTVFEETWRQLNRPNSRLRFDKVLDGMMDFASKFDGKLSTRTTLTQGYNCKEEELEGLADFLNKLKPKDSFFYPCKKGVDSISTIKKVLENRLDPAINLRITDLDMANNAYYLIPKNSLIA